jgi:hypothetical protein
MYTETNRLPSVKWGVPRLAEMPVFPARADRVIEWVRSLPVLALFGHAEAVRRCLLIGAKRTSPLRAWTSAFDP